MEAERQAKEAERQAKESALQEKDAALAEIALSRPCCGPSTLKEITEWQPPSEGKQVDAHHGFTRRGYPVGHATCPYNETRASWWG